MSEQSPNYYIKQLEIIRELESKNLLRSEVVIKFQEIIVAKLLDATNNDVLNNGSRTELVEEQVEVPLIEQQKREHIFICYSHKDKKWWEKIYIVLKPILRKEIIKIWADTQIKPGDEWREEINKALCSAKVAVLLVTPHFLASDFIAKHELPPLLKAAEQEGLSILWIAVSASMYQETEIAVYQALNNPSHPCDCLRPAMLNKELVRICGEIKHAAGLQ